MARVRYPTGVRPLLIEETARRRRIEAAITPNLERRGYAEVLLPIIDYAEPYAATGLDGRQTYRFVDRDGELVTLRSDFTPMVARALAPALTDRDLPLRVFYRGDVVRYQPSQLGRNREMFQIGAEIVGDASVEADIEILALAAELVAETGIRPLIIYNDAALFSREQPHRPLLRATTLQDLECDPSLASVAERLAAIGRAALPDCVMNLDDVDHVRGYYTGLSFRVYDAQSRGVLVAQGGRYDTLYGRFGRDAAAVGFTITIDETR